MIRNKLKRLLDDINVTVPQAVVKTGIHEYSFRRIVRNETNQIGFDTLDAICNGLNVSIADIIEHVPDDNMTPEDVEHVNERLSNVARRSSYRK